MWIPEAPYWKDVNCQWVANCCQEYFGNCKLFLILNIKYVWIWLVLRELTWQNCTLQPHPHPVQIDYCDCNKTEIWSAKTKKLNNMTTECHCQKTEIWLALHLWRFIFFKLFSPSSRMKEKLILAPLSGTTSLSEWTVSVIRQEAKNHLNFKSQVETFSTNSPLSYQFMLKLSLEKKQASTLTNNVSSHSSRWNFLRRRPLASRRLSRCARASRSPSAQRWVKFSTRCNKCNKCNIKCKTV